MSTREPQTPPRSQPSGGSAGAAVRPPDRGVDLWLQLAGIDRALARLYDLQRRSAQLRPG
jgi:hypothetical protein